MEKVIIMANEFAKAMRNADSLEEIMVAMCSTLDEWAIANKVSAKELEDMMDKCTETMKKCHATEGLGW